MSPFPHLNTKTNSLYETFYLVVILEFSNQNLLDSNETRPAVHCLLPLSNCIVTPEMEAISLKRRAVSELHCFTSQKTVCSYSQL
jgi:hypothetical protein